MGLIELQLLLSIMVANGAPILATALLKNRYAYPIDGGLVLPDGYRLLGKSKTWRGLLLALPTTAVMAWLAHLPLEVGLIIGLTAMLGDILSSFAKRRLGMESSSMALGLDQIPEVLLPLLALKGYYNLTWTAILETVIVFVILELLLSRILYRLRIRKRPY